MSRRSPDDLRPTPIPGAVKRHDLLALTQTSRETFDALCRRGQLPLAKTGHWLVPRAYDDDARTVN